MFTTYSVMRKVPDKDITEWADFIQSFYSREDAERMASELNEEEKTDIYFVEVD